MLTIFALACALSAQNLNFNMFEVSNYSAVMPEEAPVIKISEYSEEFILNMTNCPDCQKELVEDGSFSQEEMDQIVKKGKAISKVKAITAKKTTATQSTITYEAPVETYHSAPVYAPAPMRVFRSRGSSCPTCP